jgi:DNA-binding NarL/FixJ family response regulator
LLVSTDIFKEKLDDLERLVTETEETRVIVLTSRKDPDFLEGALRCGARGVIQRDWPIHQIPVAIRKATSGGVWLEWSTEERALENLISARDDDSPV